MRKAPPHDQVEISDATEEEMVHKQGTATQELKPKIQMTDANAEADHRGYFVSPKGDNEMENHGTSW